MSMDIFQALNLINNFCYAAGELAKEAPSCRLSDTMSRDRDIMINEIEALKALFRARQSLNLHEGSELLDELQKLIRLPVANTDCEMYLRSLEPGVLRVLIPGVLRHNKKAAQLFRSYNAPYAARVCEL